jgi:hypothetical protein
MAVATSPGPQVWSSHGAEVSVGTVIVGEGPDAVGTVEVAVSEGDSAGVETNGGVVVVATVVPVAIGGV